MMDRMARARVPLLEAQLTRRPIDRTTALRWIDKLKAELLAATRSEFKKSLSLPEDEADEVLSQMHLTLADRLSRVLPAIKS